MCCYCTSTFSEGQELANKHCREQTEAAIAEYDEAIKLDPEFDVAFFNRSLVYKEKGRYNRALRDLNASLALVRWRSLAKAELADAAGAKADAEKADQLGAEAE